MSLPGALLDALLFLSAVVRCASVVSLPLLIVVVLPLLLSMLLMPVVRLSLGVLGLLARLLCLLLVLGLLARLLCLLLVLGLLARLLCLLLVLGLLSVLLLRLRLLVLPFLLLRMVLPFGWLLVLCERRSGDSENQT
jgi:hypothetical protein